MSIDGQPIDWTKVELRTENMTTKEIKYWKRFKKCVEQTNKDVEKLMQGYDPPPFPLYEEERVRGWCDRQDWERKKASSRTAEAEEMTICSTCSSPLKSIGPHKWQCTKCINNDPNWIKHKVDDSEIEKQYDTLVKWSIQQQIINEHIMPDFPFGPIPHWITDRQPKSEDSPIIVYIDGSYRIWVWSIHPEGWYAPDNWETFRKECPIPWMPLPKPPHD